MNRWRLLALALVGLGAARGADTYPTAPEALYHPAIPHGEVLKRSFAGSRIYPGTERSYWIYVPAQYRPEIPACLYVGQDGIAPAGAVNVFDQLIAARQIPVTIGVFVAPGVVPAADPAHALARYNRSYEYDSPGDEYVRFLLEELLPDAARQHATDGRAIRFSERAADRAIGGSSSGAIAAFTAAWERPDSFSRVYSSVGTFVALRGGDHYGPAGNIYLVAGAPPARWSAAQERRSGLAFGPDGQKLVVDSGLKFANGIALSPDQSLLYVDDSRSHWVYSYVVAPDGKLADKQRYFACGPEVDRRRLKVQGASAWADPILPPKPKLCLLSKICG